MRIAALEQLATRIGSAAIITDPALLEPHATDWTRRWTGSTPAMVLPADAGEIVTVVVWAREHQISLVPQGGNTGLVGGATPMSGEVIVGSRRNAQIVVDSDAGTATAGAGATLGDLQRAAAQAGWHYGVDLAARDSATVGGSIATNAGGLHVLRYGDTRAQLLGIEAITGNAEVVGDLRGLVKDNTGYDIAALLAGSEGTLAIISQAVVRLHRRVEDRAVALVGFDTIDAAVAAVAWARRSLRDLSAVEIWFDNTMQLVRETFELPAPGKPSAAYLLIEVAGQDDVSGELARRFTTTPGIDYLSVSVATDDARMADLWRYRELHTEAISRVGVPHKLDITVPLREMTRFVAAVNAMVSEHRPAASVWLFGHAGDGNLHVNLTGIDPDDDEIDRLVLELVAAIGGSISAEHGIGRAKRAHLGLNRTDAELALARRIKHAFDPAGVLNPGVLV